MRGRKEAELTEQKVNVLIWRQIYEVLPGCRGKGKMMKLRTEMRAKY